MPSGKYFRVSEEIHKLVKIAAAQEGTDIGDWIDAAARAKLSGTVASPPAPKQSQRRSGHAGPEHEQLAAILASGTSRETAAVRVVLDVFTERLKRR